jgi:hypothetical protein
MLYQFINQSCLWMPDWLYLISSDSLNTHIIHCYWVSAQQSPASLLASAWLSLDCTELSLCPTHLLFLCGGKETRSWDKAVWQISGSFHYIPDVSRFQNVAWEVSRCIYTWPAGLSGARSDNAGQITGGSTCPHSACLWQYKISCVHSISYSFIHFSQGLKPLIKYYVPILTALLILTTQFDFLWTIMSRLFTEMHIIHSIDSKNQIQPSY